MKRNLLFLLVVLFFAACSSDVAETTSTPADYVDPFIGTGGHGHTFPGATVPFGMVQLSPDTRMNDWDGCSGYHISDNTILGFSHTHLSGTGVADYGDFRFMPIVGEVLLDKGTAENTASGYRSSFRHDNETAKAGYYSVLLDDYNVKVELTTGDRVGMHRYIFPDTTDAHVLLDMSEGVDKEVVKESWIEIADDGSITGYRRTRDWADDQHLYFYAEFSVPFSGVTLYCDGQAVTGSSVDGSNVKAVFDFDASISDTVVMRIALSAVDAQGAKNNLKAELSDDDFDFDMMADNAFRKWNDELKRVEVCGGTDKDLTIFYTAMYHTMIAPNLYSDADGRYRAHDMQVHQSDNNIYTVFSLWDTFRALHPYLNIMQRQRTIDIINTFLDNYDKGGLLPVWELAANETGCMIGYHAIPVIADAYFAGVGGFDAEKALTAMIKSAEQDHLGLKSYKKYGFIPIDHEGEAVSKTLEYAYDDWCIARMADDMGKDSIADVFYRRAQNYKNIYNTENGFFQGRTNGSFISPFDPAQVNFTLTEANSWQYCFFAPQDINTHIEMMGGDEAYEAKLDALFNASSETTGRKQADITGLIGQYAHGNEPSHNFIYMYNFVGKPSKAQYYLRQVLDELYSDEPDGYCGNEDCGQMSAWAVMSAIGFYPATPASGYYVLGLPRFERVTLNLENGNTFEVTANNLSAKCRYVRSVRLNDEKLERSYITIDEVLAGGKLVFEMTDDMNSTWGTSIESRPVMRIPTESIVVVPSLSGNSKTFFEDMVIAMVHPSSESEVFYTLDGRDPRIGGIRYEQPITITENALVRAAACQNGNWSKVIEAEYKKISADRTIKLENAYNEQYAAEGDIALIDMQRGGPNFRTGTWQGYYGVDLVAVVDLGEKETINRVAGSFLQDQGSWIFMPTMVEFFVSDNGTSFQSLGKVDNTISPEYDGGVTQELEIKRKIETRYVKMVAKNIGVCPEWHVGAGEKAWIFCDEFIVE